MREYKDYIKIIYNRRRRSGFIKLTTLCPESPSIRERRKIPADIGSDNALAGSSNRGTRQVHAAQSGRPSSHSKVEPFGI